MRISDLVRMALHNLWARRWRTLLNLTGVVIGCVVILMTLAGTRGVARGLRGLVESSESARLIHLHPRYQPHDENLDDIEVVGEMSDERRQKIRKRLSWEMTAHQVVTRELKGEILEEIRSLEHVVEVVPAGSIILEVEIDEHAVNAECSAVSDQDKSFAKRVIAGSLPDSNRNDQILVGEFFAYQLGYRTVEEARSLIGKTLQIKAPNRKRSDFNWLFMFYDPQQRSTLSEQIKSLETFKALFEKLDETSLSTEQVDLLKRVFSKLLTPKAEEAEEERAVVGEFQVCGIVQLPNEAVPSLIPIMGREQNNDLSMHYRVQESLGESAGQVPYQLGAIVRIDRASHLHDVEKTIQSKGVTTTSVGWLMNEIDKQISIARWIVGGIGLIVLVIAAIAISNTMVMSVMERTAELGIMKSLGARDSQVVGMVLWEGGVTGAFGALTAIAISLIITSGIEVFVRKYVSLRINEPYTGNVFEYAWLDSVETLLIAILLCVFASILPAVRAARLDPIQAMRGL